MAGCGYIRSNKKSVETLATKKVRHFRFPNIANAEGCSFVRLLPRNSAHLARLFADDFSPFTDDRFKSIESAREYAQHILDWSAYSPKHGGRDYFFRKGRQYIGVLHLYI